MGKGGGMTRNGKIARLPHVVRELLNERIRDGENGAAILEWLNGLPEVQGIVAEQFGGVPITKQNLSEWRAGGHREWLREEDARNMVQKLMDRVDGVIATTDEADLGDCLSVSLSLELVRTTEALLTEKTKPKERWRLLREILPHLAVLRRADHRAERVRIAAERWDRKVEELDEKKIRREVAEEFRAGQVERLASAASRWMKSQEPGGGNVAAEASGRTQSHPVAPGQTEK